MFTYQTQEEKIYHPLTGSYTAYGISVIYKSKLVEYVSNVFLEKEEAEAFVGLCNELELDVIHLHDVIEDMIRQKI